MYANRPSAAGQILHTLTGVVSGCAFTERAVATSFGARERRGKFCSPVMAAMAAALVSWSICFFW
jgi:hypothetical protein